MSIDRSIPARVSSYGGETVGRWQIVQIWDLHIAGRYIMRTMDPGEAPFMWEVADAWNSTHGLGPTAPLPVPLKKGDVLEPSAL